MVKTHNRSPDTCPNREQLLAFGIGRLPVVEFSQIAEHLETCTTCEATLNTLPPANDTVISALRGCRIEHPSLQEPNIELMAQRARQLFLSEDISVSRTHESRGKTLQGETEIGESAAISTDDQGNVAGSPNVGASDPGLKKVGEGTDLPGVDATDLISQKPLGLHIPDRIGNYELLEVIGQGGMGIVYLARHISLRRKVAVKLLAGNRFANPLAAARFCREMEAIGQLQHPNIVQAYDAGTADGYQYIAMELIEGVDCESLIRKHGSLEIADACEILCQAASGIQRAHDEGWIHRDIKPSNLLISRDGVVKLSDFGLARLTRPNLVGELQEQTSSGVIMGTLDYMAPEQGLAEEKIDSRADIYALGCVLYRLLSGRVPFSGPGIDTPLQKLKAHAFRQLPSIRTARPDVPESLSDLLLRMMAKQPVARPHDVLEIIEQLKPFCRTSNIACLVDWDQSRQQVVTSAMNGQLESVVGNATTVRDTQPIPNNTTHLFGIPRKKVWLLLVALLPVAAFVISRFGPSNVAPPSVSSSATAGATAMSGLLPSGQSEEELGGLSVVRYIPLNEQPRNKWIPLLLQEPIVLRLPQGPHSVFDFDAASQQVAVISRGRTMLQLGELDANEGFQFQIDIFQNRWPGGCGIFFGFQEVEIDGEQWTRFHQFDVKPFGGVDTEGRPFLMTWSKVFIRDIPGRKSLVRIFAISSQRLHQPAVEAEQLLELTIRNQRVSHVRWGGIAVDNFDLKGQHEIDVNFEPTEFSGSFGTMNFVGDAVYRNARVMKY